MVNNIVLGPIIGAVTDEYAKIWFFGEWEEGKKPECRVFPKGSAKPIKGSPFKFEALHADLHDYNNLRGRSYLARIKFPSGKNDEFVFQINTEESPDRTFKLKRAPKKGDVDFSFGLISCHNAFKNVLRDKVTKVMWKHMYSKLKDHNSSFLIQCGDQVYCDEKINAWEKSLHSRNNKEKLNYYRDVYLQSWGFKDVQNVLSAFPQLMIWDDHEITNGWGSETEHSTDPVCQDVFRVAKQVYNEFQHSHNPEPMKKDKFYYGYYYGNAAFLYLDLRGERETTVRKINYWKRPFIRSNAITLTGQILSSEQWQEIKKWLASPKTKQSKVLFVVLSVPVIHLSRGFGSLSTFVNDIMDQWSVGLHINERHLLFENIFSWMKGNNKPVIFLAGDVHVGTEVVINATFNGQRKLLFQFTSSPITNKVRVFLDFLVAFLTRFKTIQWKKSYAVKLKTKIIKRHRKRNFGIVEVKYKKGIPEIFFNMYRKGEKNSKRRMLVYDPQLGRYKAVKL